ncbi:exonuclease V [Aspergillus tanneri]|uniref:Uncharacterized protein n=1 Tax=Aspergillus tanneri TaxID=1220188 RepID=A0A5M9N3G5_9EURO|nr:uncharacterized protein ATNIH1004_000629 [Aspergillus tanneri]KAA8651733.1 hypothetical protein ATNIH1004_000629 [Aspergillus tanneri]
MSCPPPPQTLTLDIVNDSSDYGSDFTPDEEEILNELLVRVDPERATEVDATIATTAPAQPPLQSTITTTTVVQDIENYNEVPSTGRPPRVLGRQKPAWQIARTQSGPPAAGSSIEHPDSTEGRTRDRERHVAREKEWINDSETVGSRSPLERFRRPPNKAFSVTDLVSPAWCELQYWYTLTKHGRKRRTPAMKLGSTIHKSLEDEIYTTVPVEITTKEDALALRIWNVIQGLRTLREYGITRELEVWGIVNGELVSGVIDQLSYVCPDSELEATAASYYADVEASRAVLPEYQMSLTDYLLSPSQGGKRLSDMSWDDENLQGSDNSFISDRQSSAEVFNLPRIYMTDIKTRGSSRSIPTVKSTSFRPTLLQLQMYYHMLNRLVTTDEVSIEILASRYGLDPHRTFTDAFITEVGGLNDQFFDALSSQEFDRDHIPTSEDALVRRLSSQHSADADSADSAASASQDSTGVLLTNRNLASLWRFMKDQLRLTFIPQPLQSSSVLVAPSIPSEFQPHMLESYPTVLSPLLTARYLSSTPVDESKSRALGSRSFLFDPITMTSYLSDQMEWWRGEREPRGVEIMEAWKCRICEFNDECSWRQEKEWAFARRWRGRKSSDSATA